MLPQRYRLRRSREIGQVRRLGKRWRHPLLTLYTYPNNQEVSRFAVVTGRHIGKAVVRNRSKRRVREAIHHQLCLIPAGWDCLFVARKEVAAAAFTDIEQAVQQLLQRAGLLRAAV